MARLAASSCSMCIVEYTLGLLSYTGCLSLRLEYLRFQTHIHYMKAVL